MATLWQYGSIPNRPMICTQVSVDGTSTWTFDLDVSLVTQFDLNVTVTIPEGEYFVTGHGRFGDDLLATLGAYLNNELNPNNIHVNVYHDTSTNLVGFAFGGSAVASGAGRDIRLNFSAMSSTLCGVLGSDGTDKQSTAAAYPSFQMDRQPAYVWYAPEDNLLDQYTFENSSSADILETYLNTNKSAVINKATYYGRRMEFSNIPAKYVWSNLTDYLTEPPYPWVRNQGLECWYREAMKGKRFRVYTHYLRGDSYDAAGYGTIDSKTTGGTTTTFSDASLIETWPTDPDRWGRCVVELGDENRSNPLSPYVTTEATANDSNTVTVYQLHTEYPWAAIGTTVRYRIYDIWGEEFYLDLSNPQSFEPDPVPGFDRYNIGFDLIASTNESDPTVPEPS